MADSTSRKSPKCRSAVSILRAAKAVGCHSVEFPDGTVVRITPESAAIVSIANGASVDANEWNGARPM